MDTKTFCVFIRGNHIKEKRKAYFIRTPIDFLNACVNASVLLISREKISLPAMLVNGVSVPRA